MPAAKKRPSPRPLLDRAAKPLREHSKGINVTLASAGAFVTILAVVWPFVPKLMTVEAADLAEKQIRAEMERHAKEDQVRDETRAKETKAFHTEALAGQQNILTTITRNALKECEKSAKKILACEEEKRAYDEANSRNTVLFKSLTK